MTIKNKFLITAALSILLLPPQLIAEDVYQAFSINGDAGQIYANQGKKEVIGNAVAKTQGLTIRSHRIIESVNNGEKSIAAEGNTKQQTSVLFESQTQKVSIKSGQILLKVAQRVLQVKQNIQLSFELFADKQTINFSGDSMTLVFDETNQVVELKIKGKNNQVEVISADKGKLNAVADLIHFNKFTQQLDMENASVELANDRFEAAKIHVDLKQMLLSAPKQDGKRIKFTRELEQPEKQGDDQ